MTILNSRHSNGWLLLYWLMGINSVVVLAYTPTQAISTPTGILEMIQMSVRCTVPFLYLAFVASSLHRLWPTSFSRWLLKNRRYIGLAFAASMGWQLVFILLLWGGHWDYYVREVYNFGAIVFEAPGYLFIFAMTITSFMPVRRKMNDNAWRVLHWVSIYFLWFAITLTYYYEVAGNRDVQVIDYIYLVAGVAVYVVRLGAWGARLSQRIIQPAKPSLS
jgi:sulfoxide reductase heme-binding subunit YedZ